MNKVNLCVLDGVRLSKKNKGNAFSVAKTPNIDKLMDLYKYSSIDASGKSVGLPDHMMGNSEVGHLSIGAGRVIKQPLTIINDSIKDNSFYDNDKLLKAIKHAKKNKSKLHIIGMLSDGQVHSNITHFKALIKLCALNNFNNVYFHIITDGRDTYYDASKKYLDELTKEINRYNIGSISTIIGRFYMMDRDKRWERIKKAYDLITFGVGTKYDSVKEAIESNYKNEKYDEFLEPCIIDENGLISSNDSIIWANFRPDRSTEILSSIVNKKFDYFKRKKLKNIYLTTFMWVPNVKSEICFSFDSVNNTLGEVIGKMGLRQLRIAETEKYAHVTYFFDGLKNVDYVNEKKILIPSDKIKTYDIIPKMKANEITDTLIKELKNNYAFTLVNFANGDMVGHTGNLESTIIGLEEIDKCIGRLYNACIKNNYLLIITADHGNCEDMLDENNKMLTTHTTNKVPFIVCASEKVNIESLTDIAPYILNLMNLQLPSEMK